MTEDWMKCCRYCRSYNQGCCSNTTFEMEVDNNIDQIIDDGLISEAIREAISVKETEISKADIETIDEALSTMLRNNLGTEYEFKPVDPTTFYCSLWG